MLLRLLEGNFQEFKNLWDGNEQQKQAIRKSIRISYYLIHHVWRVPDSIIAKAMNETRVEGYPTRKFQDQWIKHTVARDLGGKDLLWRVLNYDNNKDDDRKTRKAKQPPKNEQRQTREQLVDGRFKEINVAEAYQLFMAMRKLAKDAEKPIPDFIEELKYYSEHAQDDKFRLRLTEILSSSRGNTKEGDIAKRRLDLVKRRSSFFGEILSVFEGITADVNFAYKDGDNYKNVAPKSEAIIALTLYFRRLVEKEVELFLLTSMEQGSRFKWNDYIEDRQKQTDDERSVRYPELLQLIQGMLTGQDSREFYNLMDRLIA